MTSYRIPKRQNAIAIEIKRSRFIAYAQHTKSSQDAKAFVKELKDKYPDARHHCYAFIAGSPSNSNLYGFSDDGEPNGTAGMPIFTHLKHSQLGEICIVVVRYFGGTKLGTGGLARAYSEATKQVLESLLLTDYVEMKTLIIKLEFALEAEVRKAVSAIGGKIKEVKYTQEVQLTIETPKGQDLVLPYSVELLPKSTI